MNCLEFRQRKLSDPADSSAGLVAHRDECARCRQFETDLKQFDADISDAFAVPVPEDLEARVLLRQSFGDDAPARPTAANDRWRWIGMAASFATAAILIGLVTRPVPVTALEQHLASHLGIEEMMASVRTDPVSDETVSKALADAGIDMDMQLENVMHAKACVIDGKLVAHLVVRRGDEDLTVLLTPFTVSESSSFNASGYAGMIEPAKFGSIAVMTADTREPANLRGIFQQLSPENRATGD